MAAVALLLVITFSLAITRSAAVMLELTGMSRDSARFQARAAYCGVGYSGRESGGILQHPVRRRIISTLMLLGNAGTATVVATLILSFTTSESHWLIKLLFLLVGIGLLSAVASSSWVDARMTAYVQWALKKYTRLDLNDYVALLHLSQGYSVLEFEVQPGDWLGGAELRKLSLPNEGVLVLGIDRLNGSYVGVPSGATQVNVGDVLTVYGKLDRLEELNHRRLGMAGTYAHAAAVNERQKEALEEEEAAEVAPVGEQQDVVASDEC